MGEAFIKHELDEAIAVQQCIVEAETRLAGSHPAPSAQRVIKQSLSDDKQFLSELQRLGREHQATGEVEDVAGGLKELTDTILKSATQEGADSDFYEAHAVLLNLKRKQMDSAGAMIKIARAQKDTKMRDAASKFERAQKDTAKALSAELATFAVQIASGDGRN